MHTARAQGCVQIPVDTPSSKRILRCGYIFIGRTIFARLHRDKCSEFIASRSSPLHLDFRMASREASDPPRPCVFFLLRSPSQGLNPETALITNSVVFFSPTPGDSNSLMPFFSFELPQPQQSLLVKLLPLQGA